jgi:peptidylprolyl isomerase
MNEEKPPAASQPTPASTTPAPASTPPAAPPAEQPAEKAGATVTTPSGLQYIDLKVGDGPSPTPGSTVVVHYTGWLTNGTKFDSSVDRGQPFQFMIGMHQVIAGWDEGVMSMKTGGKRKLTIPPQLGYGQRAMGNVIPANSTLIFDVELIAVK